jgi:hypothetical protein
MLLVPLFLQAAVMIVDEFHCHRRRGLPLWERLGHPLDTLSVIACVGWLLRARPSQGALAAYVALCAFSCLLITKDELIHRELCDGLEHWLHSLLFVLHPVTLLALGRLWWSGEAHGALVAQFSALIAFAAYQLVYWNLARSPSYAAASRQ